MAVAVGRTAVVLLVVSLIDVRSFGIRNGLPRHMNRWGVRVGEVAASMVLEPVITGPGPIRSTASVVEIGTISSAVVVVAELLRKAAPISFEKIMVHYLIDDSRSDQ